MEEAQLAFLEGLLGPLSRAWGTPLQTWPPLVLEWKDQPHRGAHTFITSGLGRCVLDLGDGRTVRQELLLAVNHPSLRDESCRVLELVAEDCARSNRALLRGDVIRPGERIFKKFNPVALYCSIPVYYPDSLAVWDGTDPPTVFVWLVPIMSRESDFVNVRGWDSFEDVLQEVDPDLLDLRRKSAV